MYYRPLEEEMRKFEIRFWTITYPTWCFADQPEWDGKIKGLGEWLKNSPEETDKVFVGDDASGD